MFSFFRKKDASSPPAESAATPSPQPAPPPASAQVAPAKPEVGFLDVPPWMVRLSGSLKKTGSDIATVFTGAQIDDALYEQLEEALLMADAGPAATAHLLGDLKRRVKDAKTTEPAAVKGLLAHALADLLRPLERPLVIGRNADGSERDGPTIIMVAGVNGAGKTTTIGKLTRHLSDAGAKVLLAAGDTFRAAAREQLAAWADRNARGGHLVDIIASQGGDPAAVAFDAVAAGTARKADVVLVDTAGRLPTQLHLMDELKKIKRSLSRASPQTLGPHEVLLVIDGNTGQNALSQVKIFDDAIGLTGLVVTKLDGTAKGGAMAAIALWAAQRPVPPGNPPLAIYFIGIGEQLEDLQPFRADEYANALLT
jgi:fused signal recognition particle receptor